MIKSSIMRIYRGDESEQVVPLAESNSMLRGEAYRLGKTLQLACALFPIIGTTHIVELLRHPGKYILPDQWICFLSEHVRPEDREVRAALQRGVYEELGYYPALDTIHTVTKPIKLSYTDPQKRVRFQWLAHFYIVPLSDINQLHPDGNEIIGVRQRDINHIVKEAHKKCSFYRGFTPQNLISILQGEINDVLRTLKGAISVSD